MPDGTSVQGVVWNGFVVVSGGIYSDTVVSQPNVITNLGGGNATVSSFEKKAGDQTEYTRRSTCVLSRV